LEAFTLTVGAVALWLLFYFRQSQKQTRLRPKRADIRVDTRGVYFSRSHQEGVEWMQVEKVTLEWDENPWGDPQFGAYCDTDWVLHGKNKTTRIWQSSGEPNNEILIPAMRNYLPGFRFDLAGFEIKYASRLFDLKGGSVLIWERHEEP
jgi:hypothetical protein